MSGKPFAEETTRRVHPARQRLAAACAALAAIAGLSVLCGMLMESAWWGVFAAAILLFATRRFFFPGWYPIEASKRNEPMGPATPAASRVDSLLPEAFVEAPDPASHSASGASASNSGQDGPRGSRWSRFQHAFAVDPPGPAEPTPPQRAVVERLCREIVRRRLTTPALAFLEMSRPLNYVAAQTMHFFAPIVSAITDARGHEELAAYLERRGSVDYVLARIEALETEAETRETAMKKET